jgi:ribosomal protein S18 acetylase RimI-like enzyme
MPSFSIAPYTLAYANVAADLHIEGQPGTFLTSMGRAFLRALYAQMAVSPLCFGYVAVEGDEVVGVVTGAVDSGAVFKDLVLKKGHKLVLPVLGSVLRHPSLAIKIVQTLFYPAQTKPEPGECEMLYVASRADRRGQGIGHALWWAFADGCREKGYRSMALCVDVGNPTAVRFHERQGMRLAREFTMYGRPFRWYVLPLRQENSDHDDADRR